MKLVTSAALIAATLALPFTVMAQESADSRPAINPACADAPFRDFDFFGSARGTCAVRTERWRV